MDSSNGAIFDITWKKESLIFKLKRWFRWLFNIRKAFLELTDSHEELLNQYNKLEESKRALLKQTTQLKTANNISKTIRQTFDIKNTLFKITEALIRDADFDFASIKLFKDLEGNKFEIFDSSGSNSNNSIILTQQVIINDEQIGELILSPKLGMDKAECEELLNYLQPIITISIHDALVLRTVTDYKNNLETKVEIRTAELKKAQEKLSKTIHLLEDSKQTQNRFFTNISHEFRTPLTLILGPVKQIAEKIRDENIKEELGMVHRNADKLLELVNQLLDISKLESGNMKLETVSAKCLRLVKIYCPFFQFLCRKKKHQHSN